MDERRACRRRQVVMCSSVASRQSRRRSRWRWMRRWRRRQPLAAAPQRRRLAPSSPAAAGRGRPSARAASRGEVAAPLEACRCSECCLSLSGDATATGGAPVSSLGAVPALPCHHQQCAGQQPSRSQHRIKSVVAALMPVFMHT
jgi:hypothetical protein